MTGYKRHIHLQLFGRLGNNLFQLAAGASLAKRYQAELNVFACDHILPDPTCSLAGYLPQFSRTVLRNVRISWESPCDTIRYEEPYFHYTPIPFQDNMLLFGYFQSEKYFDLPLVSQLFGIDEETRCVLHEKYGYLLQKGVTSINVRRGDYLDLQAIHPVCPPEYFQQAMQLIGEKEEFIVTSDDMEWCRQHFSGANIHFADDSTVTRDLYLQALCRNNIISNSTFSWWGAWLNSNPAKRVVAPRNWFGPAYAGVDTRDLLPVKWIKI